MQVVSFMNMKGGVGKTTLAVNVAYALAYFYGKKILIVDADPQFNATQCLLEDDVYLSHINDPKKRTIHDIFDPKRVAPIRTVTGKSKPASRPGVELSSCICQIVSNTPTKGRLDLLPSNLTLIEVENSPRGAENRLTNFLSQKAAHYDFVFIDCPPTISIFTQAAILASNKYLVPIKPDPLSVIGLPLLERWLEEFVEDRGCSISRVGLVFTMVRGPVPQRMRDVMAEVRKPWPGEVFSAELSQATAVAGSVDKHLPVFLHKRNSKSAGQIQRIAAEFVARVGK